VAELVAGFGVPHTPLLWRLMADDVPRDLRVVSDEFARFRRLFEAARPDVALLIGSDHFHQFDYSAMPAFSIGRADHIAGTFPNEERSFGLPRVELPGHCGLARALLGHHELAGGFDFSFSNRPHLDHAYVVPLLYLMPGLDIPVVPIHTNTNAPPLPPVRRFLDLGRHIRAAIEAYPADLRVVAIATGHLAFELGGPATFQGRSSDPAFDTEAIDLIRRSDLGVAADTFVFDRLLAAGNLTFQVLNFLTLSAAMDRSPTTAEGVACRFGHEPFFSWEAS
jgi:protocatechuate 4,5-dioxygenase, beta chain